MNSNTIQLNIHSTSILARMRETQDEINRLNIRISLEGNPVILEVMEISLATHKAAMAVMSEQLLASIN